MRAIADVARRLKETRGASPPKSSMSMTAAATPRSRSRSGLPADALDVQVVSLSRNFGKEAALLAGLDHARLRRRAVHGRRRPASADSGRDAGRAIGSMTATT